MNTPVSYKLAKLLKEKGFDDFTQIWYQHGEGISGCVEGKRDYYNRKGDIYTSAPTISDVCMWLYEKHEIWISVDWMSRTKPYNSGFYCHLRGTNKNLNQDNFVSINNTKEPGYEVFNSPTEAYEAAIEYTLNNLVLTKNK